MKNSQRVIVKIIREICNEQKIKFESFSYDWILRLSQGEKSTHVYGYQFENNTATAQLICTDKSATSELLRASGVPSVPHHFFINPDDLQYVTIGGNWQGMLDLLERYQEILLKPNEGTGGVDIYRASNPTQLETAAAKIFSRYKSLAISPFLKIEQEYRVIILNQQVNLIYSKKIPQILGDGTSTIRQLFFDSMKKNPLLILESEWIEKNADAILPKGEQIPVSWKHNLGQGALPEIVTDSTISKLLSNLALLAAKTININFASVDIIKVHGQLQILEINSGIMMESFACQNQHNYQIAKEIYQQALEVFFH